MSTVALQVALSATFAISSTGGHDGGMGQPGGGQQHGWLGGGSMQHGRQVAVTESTARRRTIQYSHYPGIDSGTVHMLSLELMDIQFINRPKLHFSLGDF